MPITDTFRSKTFALQSFEGILGQMSLNVNNVTVQTRFNGPQIGLFLKHDIIYSS